MVSKVNIPEEIYILFGGPSIKGFDLSKLNGKHVLGCNKSAEIYPCDGVISIDKTYINSKRNFLKNYKGYVALASNETKASPMYNKRIVDWIEPDFLYWHNKRKPDTFSENNEELTGRHTGHAAINFAMLNGVKTIHALGLDLNVMGWWHSGYTSQCNQRWMLNWAKSIDDCKPTLDKWGVTLFNYNLDSAVRNYPFRAIDSL